MVAAVVVVLLLLLLLLLLLRLSHFCISYVLLCVHSSINSFENGSSRELGTRDAKT